jgi:hypothetical protein
MIEALGRPRHAALTGRSVFGPLARADFASSYPEGPHKLAHELRDHPLLALDALAALGEALPDASVEYNRGDLPVGITGKPGSNGLTIGQTIRNIATSNSWAALKNIEQSPTYAGLLHDILAELKPIIERRTGKMLKPQGYIFISSPDAVTPYHFDPEHNILLQLRGTKVMTVFPAGANEYAPDMVHESYHRGGARELTWHDSFLRDGMPFSLEPGEALFVPVMSPHFVKNGPEISISLSVTWRSEWSFAEADARAFNGLLRKWGFDPKPPGRWPSRNRLKAWSWRLLRRLPGI